jgi:transposase
MLVTVGVDTHTDVHVAAVLDEAGRLLETAIVPATTRGYARLATWAESFGTVDKVGMEGTGSFGAGLLRFLADYGLAVIEVDRPDRSGRRRNGKSDPLDAESAARAVQSGRASGIPKSRDAQVEMIRVLRVARRGAMKARIQAGAQIDAVIVSAPEPVRGPLRKLNPRRASSPAPPCGQGRRLTPRRRPRLCCAALPGSPLAGAAGRNRGTGRPAHPAGHRRCA